VARPMPRAPPVMATTLPLRGLFAPPGAAVDRHRHGVDRADRLVGDPLALEQRAHGLQPVAIQRGLLELLGVGGRVHAGVEVALDLAIAARQEVDHALDAAPVVLA